MRQQISSRHSPRRHDGLRQIRGMPLPCPVSNFLKQCRVDVVLDEGADRVGVEYTAAPQDRSLHP